MRRFNIIEWSMLTFILGISCGLFAGCDFLIPGECRGAGGLYGPCVDHGCVDGLTCFSGVSGEMCVTTTPPGDEEIVCRAPISGITINTEDGFFGAYLIRCNNDGECSAGTVCDEINGACLYPYDEHDVQPPPGAELGPCDPNLDTGCGYHLDTCVELEQGSLCVRKDHPEWIVPCSTDKPYCPNGQVCAEQDGMCVWPDGPVMCLDPGLMFGPCVDQKCASGLLCMTTTQGSICTPDLDVADENGVEACALERGLFGLYCDPEWETCHVPCTTDKHCVNGTVCAEDWEICVYPQNQDDVKPPPGETLGPCMGDDMLCLHDTDTCVVSGTVNGNVCNRTGQLWLAQCSAEDETCPNGQVCALDKSVCVWPN